MDLDLLVQDIQLTGESWVKFDKVTKTIRGLPWDIEPPKNYQYTLKCTDSMGATAEHDIEVRIISQSSYSEPNNMFGLVVDEKYSLFANDLQKQLGLYDKLSMAFKTAGEPKLVIQGISKGSVVVNCTLQNTDESCDRVQEYSDLVFDGRHQLKNSFIKQISPYVIKELSFEPLAPCEYITGGTGRITPAPVVLKDFNILYIIVPIVIVVVILAIVIIVVCCIKRRKKKSHNISKSNGNGMYIEKGVPCVFEEEMKDIKSEPNESDPFIEQNSNTPKPPAYPQNGTKSHESTPLKSAENNHTDGYPPTPPISEHDDKD